MANVETKGLIKEENFCGQPKWSKLSFTDKDTLRSFLEDCAGQGLTLSPLPAKNVPARFWESKLAFFDLGNQDKILEHSGADKVLKVETGISIKSLQDYLSQHGEWWPCGPFPQGKTLFDVIHSGEGGFYEHAFGGPRHLVLGLEALTGEGKEIKCGGRVVKNVTGFDLVKLFVGARSTLSIPTCAYLRLYSLPKSECTIFCAQPNLNKAFLLARKLQKAACNLAACEIFSGRFLSDAQKKTGDRALTKFLQNLKVSGAEACFLLLQIQGHEETVKQSQNEVGKVLSEAGLSPLSVAEDQAKLFWQLLASQNQDDYQLSLAGSKTILESFLSALSQSKMKFLWRLNPGLSRLDASLSKQEDLEAAVNLLKDLCQKEKEPCQIAFPDQEFSLRLSLLPEEDQAQKTLKACLKAKFDPKQILNPLVSL